MRFLTVFLLALFVATLPQAGPSVLYFGHLWDGSRLLDDVAVVVEGDRIVSVTEGTKTLPPGALDLRRYTAIPGLIDLHTHMTYYWDSTSGTDPWRQPPRTPEQTVQLARNNAV